MLAVQSVKKRSRTAPWIIFLIFFVGISAFLMYFTALSYMG